MNFKILLVLLALVAITFLAANAKLNFSPPITALLFDGGEQKLAYSFDDVEVLYAAKFTVSETPSTARAWADQIAAPGEEITVTYGIVILKNRDSEAEVSQESAATAVSQGSMKEEWIKVEGSRGSERMLENALLNEFDSAQQNIVASKTQFSSHKKLVGSSIVKDFTQPIRTIYLFRQLSGGELVATYVCFKSDSSDFWQVAQSRDSCFVTKDVLKEIGASTETTGQVPVNAIAVKKPECPEDFECLTKEVGPARDCVVLASYACGGDANSCFKCQGSGAFPTPSTTPTPTPTPSPTPQCVFTGTGCCYADNLNTCMALPPDSCGTDLVANVTGCLGGGCQAAFQCIPSVTPTPSPSPSPSPTPTPSPQPDSCSDSDNGLDYFTGGATYGFANGGSYNHSDACLDTVVLLENFCSGTDALGQEKNCSDFNTENQTYSCVTGTCKIS